MRVLLSLLLVICLSLVPCSVFGMERVGSGVRALNRRVGSRHHLGVTPPKAKDPPKPNDSSKPKVAFDPNAKIDPKGLVESITKEGVPMTVANVYEWGWWKDTPIPCPVAGPGKKEKLTTATGLVKGRPRTDNWNGAILLATLRLCSTESTPACIEAAQKLYQLYWAPTATNYNDDKGEVYSEMKNEGGWGHKQCYRPDLICYATENKPCT